MRAIGSPFFIQIGIMYNSNEIGWRIANEFYNQIN